MLSAGQTLDFSCSPKDCRTSRLASSWSMPEVTSRSLAVVRTCAITTLPENPTPCAYARPASLTARRDRSRAFSGSAPTANSWQSSRTASARWATASGIGSGTGSSSSIIVTERRIRVPVLRIARSIGSAASA